MHRFPNPGSNIDNLIKCFELLYENINRDVLFGLHDMQEILVVNGLISSSGTMGAEALLRGANVDLSRDRSYNQCKMYAEIYRSLGWMQSAERALDYCFTFLGDHIATAQVDSKALIEECFIGIEFPNKALAVNGANNIRPFASILKCMAQLDGVMTRDEIIIGPLCFENDQTPVAIESYIDKVQEYRADPALFDAAFEAMLEDRGITKITAGNYTRFPLGALRWLGWAEQDRDTDHFESPTRVYRLTEKGRLKVEELDSSLDLRLEDIENYGELGDSIAKYSYYTMLTNSGFDLSSKREEIAELKATVIEILGTENVLFSPFQAYDSESLSRIFNYSIPTARRESIYSPRNLDTEQSNDFMRDQLATITRPEEEPINRENSFFQSVSELAELADRDIVANLKPRYSGFGKEEYYTLIGEIFCVMGLNCHVSPHGVNSRRWDAIIIEENDSIPIEIKSPTEEVHLSVKAVRQAVENKIILQSRQAVANQRTSNSLAVGFELPNNRADVGTLINDIDSTYNIKVAVLGIDYLLQLAVDCIRNDNIVSFDELSEKLGIVDA